MTIELELNDTQMERLASMVAIKLRAGMATTYSVTEAAKLLGVCSKTVSRRVEAKVYPRVPGLKSIRIPAAFIDRLLNPDPTA